MTATTPHAMDGPVLVDGHVHLHRCFDVEVFLAGAARNFSAAARRLGLPGRPFGALLLTESAGVDRFDELARRAGADPIGAYRIATTGERQSLLVLGEDGLPRLALVAGRQVVTRERLEVLALGCREQIPDGGGLIETVERVRERGALPVVPWGFGKWWFGRGRRIARLIDEQRPGELWFGDNGGRPAAAGRPKLFDAAERRGFGILPGTDPLPFPHHATRAGSFGFVLRAPLDPARPAASILGALRDPESAIRPYGAGERLVPFLRNQIGMQLVKRSREVAT